MQTDKLLTIIIILIFSAGIVAAALGIISNSGAGSFTYNSIRNNEIEIHGKGFYRHMSKEVAIQGIAQDYITLFLAIPLLIITFLLWKKGNLTAGIILEGTLLYFFVTYLFYLCMCMYNELFLVYIVLVSSSFFGFIKVIINLSACNLDVIFDREKLTKSAGIFLMVNSILIALMWLGVVIPPLKDGSIFPNQLEHYTTLIVQGLDLALFLPMSFVSGWLIYHKNRWGFLFAPVYLVFLSILMTALSAKITAMGLNGYNIIPAIIIIPLINLMSILLTGSLLNYSSKRKL